MSKKVFNLVSACVTAAGTIACAVVTYCEPSNMAAITASITVGVGAIITICGHFKKEE